MIIAVSQRIDKINHRNEIRDSLDERLLKWIMDCDYYPVPVPNTFYIANNTQAKQSTMLNTWLESVSPHAVILSGGNNLGDYPQRDSTEKHLLNWAENRKIPLLGICRGMQMIAVSHGANLIPAINHSGTRHKLIINDKEKNWPDIVNSYHDWKLDSCPKEFNIMAISEDETIEAIKHKSLPWEGWMWHPEREKNPVNEDRTRFLNLVNTK